MRLGAHTIARFLVVMLVLLLHLESCDRWENKYFAVLQKKGKGSDAIELSSYLSKQRLKIIPTLFLHNFHLMKIFFKSAIEKKTE